MRVPRCLHRLGDTSGWACVRRVVWTRRWDYSSIRGLLSRSLADNRQWLAGYELGNEELNPSFSGKPNPPGKISIAEAVADLRALRGITDAVWGGAGAVPLYAPAMDNCHGGIPAHYLEGAAASLDGFSLHSYPGSPWLEGMPAKLTQLAWLRSGVLLDDQHAGAPACLAAAAAHSLPTALTETNTGYAIWTAPADPERGFMRGFRNGFW